ncbi:MAG TPA: hypothetical protein DIT18_09740, partial [Pseudomonas sp.]|nr:hypothetical protein [Pseudomonas sp.]
SQLGDQTITVRSLRDDDHFDFKVKVVTPHSELKPDKGPDSPGMVPINPAEGKFAVEPGLLSRLSIRALRSDGSGDDECRLTFTLVSGADPDALGVVFDPPFGETVNCGPDGVALLNIDCTQAAFLPNSDPHSNEFTVQVMSNLGVSLELKLRLRYLLDLAKSELHFFRGTNDYFDQAGFSGRLRRRNGDAPLLLRDGARTLRLTLDGVPDAVETQILAYEQEGTWLHAPVFTGKTGEVGTRCTFQAAGDLGKRIQFAGSSVYEAKKVIGDGVLVAAASDDPGLIVDGTLYIVDQGGTYDLSLVLSDGEGPIAGAVLLPPSIKVEGVEFRCSGPTDASGRTHIEVDTVGASLGATHAIAAMVGNVVRNVRVRVVEMVQTEVDMALNDARQLDATVTFTRREGRSFADVGSWSGYIRIVDGFIAPFAVGHHPQRVTWTREGLDTPVPAVLQVGLSLPTSLRRLLIGDTEFPITDDMAEKGDES